MDTTTSAIKLKSRTDEALKTFQQNKKYWAKDRDTMMLGGRAEEKGR